MIDSLRPLREILLLNSDLVANCLRGLSSEEATSTPVKNGSSAIFLLAHLLHARYYVLEMLGEPLKNPHAQAFDAVSSIEEASKLPALEEMQEDWNRVSAHLAEALTGVKAEALQASAPQEFPVGDDSLLGALSFLTQHECYHLGQLGLLRRALGHESMSYDRGQTA